MYKILEDYFNENANNLTKEEQRIFIPLFQRIHLKLIERISLFKE